MDPAKQEIFDFIVFARMLELLQNRRFL